MYPFAEKYSGEGIFLNSNINPFGPSNLAVEEMKKAIKKANFYPEGHEKLKELILDKLKNEGLKVNSTKDIVLTNGSDEAIELVIRFLDLRHRRKGITVITGEGVFPFYEYSAKALGVKLIKVKLVDFGYDVDSILKTAYKNIPCLICISHPINPTGKIIPRDEYTYLIKEISRKDGIYLLSDEAYFEFAYNLNGEDGRGEREYISALFTRNPQVFVTRTFSKVYGLAGIRLGYLVSEHSDYIEMRIKQPFNVNSVAIAGGIGALKDKKFFEKTVKNNIARLKDTEKFFSEIGVQYVKSWANFIFFSANPEIYRKLMERKIFIRDMSKYGFAGFFRVSMGKKKDMEIFKKYFLECFKQKL